MTLTCSHPDCRHRLADRQCGLLAGGGAVVLNVIGQCEMREPLKEVEEPKTAPCARCEGAAVNTCARCGIAVCAAHRSWLGSGTNEDRRKVIQPFCDQCVLEHVERLLSE